MNSLNSLRQQNSSLRAPAIVSAPETSARKLGVDFARHTAIYTAANVASLACNAVLAFLLPRLLSIENYGYYRIFMLYGAYAGFLHFGFPDGLLIRWAESPELIHREKRPALRFLALQHLLIIIPLAIVLAVSSSTTRWIAIAVALYVIAWNWTTLAQYAIQACKYFEQLSVFVLLAPLVLLLSVLGLHFLGHLTLYSLLTACALSYLAAGAIQWIFVDLKITTWPSANLWATGFSGIHLGWTILGANLLAAVALSLDRILLSARFSIRDFAIYSFAANALSLTYNMILSVSRVVFPYLASDISAAIRGRAYAIGETAVLLLWTIGLASYFPIAALIRQWLPAYVESLPILRILFLATGLTASIHVLHSTYFRVARQQHRFLIGAIVGLGTAALLLWMASRSFSLAWFAWAMVASALAWWITDEFLITAIVGRHISAIALNLALIAASGSAFLASVSRPSLTQGVSLYLVWCALLLFALRGRFSEALHLSRSAIVDHGTH